MTRPLLLLATLSMLSSCNGGMPEPAVTVAGSSIMGAMDQPATIAGRDGGQSGLLHGKSVWVYGDTVLTEADEDGLTWHHNSFGITGDLDASDGIHGFTTPLDSMGAPLHLLAPTPTELEFNMAHAMGDDCAEPCGARWACWPGPPLYDEASATGYLFYGLVYAEPGDFAFSTVGYSVAVWPEGDPLPTRPEIGIFEEHPTLLFGEGNDWGNAAVLHDGTIHALGCTKEGLDTSCALASVPADHVLDRAAWRFWDGKAWSTDEADAIHLFYGAPIMTLGYLPFVNQWAVVYSSPLTNRVAIRTAPELTGPWSKDITLFVAERVTDDDGWVYDAVWHPEYDQDGGRIIHVTHSRPTGTGWFDAELIMWQVTLAPAE